MRKIIFLLVLISLKAATSFSQVNVANLGFNYSALVRDTAGRVQPSKAVKLRFTLLLGQNGSTANSPYIETQSTNTDAYGFVNVSIGNGVKAGGTASNFTKVDFALASYWILIEVFNTFTSKYEPLAKQALQAVPYAKVAGAVVGGQIIPPGTIVAFGGDTSHIPEGWMLCNGRQLDNGDLKYQSLFNAIQYNWGTSNHANLFNLPNTSGLFLRGVDYGSGNDPEVLTRDTSAIGSNVGGNVGSKQADEYKSHNHRQVTTTSLGGHVASLGDINRGPSVLQNFGTGFAGGAETRPRNVYVNYIIKL